VIVCEVSPGVGREYVVKEICGTGRVLAGSETVRELWMVRVEN